MEPTILTIEEVKSYLRLEESYLDEDAILSTFMLAAEGYLETHVGSDVFAVLGTAGNEKPTAKAKIYCLAIVAEFYDSRSNEGISEGLKSTLSLLGNQLKYGVTIPEVV